jgi:hypothetical protein
MESTLNKAAKVIYEKFKAKQYLFAVDERQAGIIDELRREGFMKHEFMMQVSEKKGQLCCELLPNYPPNGKMYEGFELKWITGFFSGKIMLHNIKLFS